MSRGGQISSHAVFGRVSDRLHGRLALQALEKDITMWRPPKGLIHYSYRGSQYCSLGHHGFHAGKGKCYDKAIVETFFKTLKSELIWIAVLQTRQDAEIAIARYIEGFSNPLRRHFSLYLSPADLRR